MVYVLVVFVVLPLVPEELPPLPFCPEPPDGLCVDGSWVLGVGVGVGGGVGVGVVGGGVGVSVAGGGV